MVRPRRSADEEANEATNRVFKAKLKILDIMKSRPDVVDSLLSYAEDRVNNYTKSRPNNKPTDDVRWPATYMTIAKLPKYWRAQHIAAHCAGIGLTASVVELLDKANPTAVNNLWEFLTALTPTSKLPRSALDKQICDRLYAARIQSIGRATTAWFSRAVDLNTYEINWTKAGCYAITKKGAKVVLSHIGGDEVVFVPTS